MKDFNLGSKVVKLGSLDLFCYSFVKMTTAFKCTFSFLFIFASRVEGSVGRRGRKRETERENGKRKKCETFHFC